METEGERIRVLFVLPAYQKFPVLAQLIASLKEISAAQDWISRIVIVDDGSTDELRMSQNVDFGIDYLLRHAKNTGKGSAIRSALAFHNGEIFCLFDADLDIGPSCLVEMISAVNSGACDIAIASKRHPQSKVEYPPIRRLLSSGFMIIQKVILRLPVDDSQTGAKVFSPSCVRYIRKSRENGFLIDIEILVLANDAHSTIRSFPVEIKHKFNSTVRMTDIWRMFFGLLRLRAQIKRDKGLI